MVLIWLVKGVFYNLFLLCMKMSDSTYYQKNRDVIRNRAKDYYENNKVRLREQARVQKLI